MYSMKILDRKHWILLFFSIVTCNIFVFSQSIKYPSPIVKGQVTDAQTKEAIPFAFIKIMGTTNGTMTDIDGNFTLRTNTNHFNIIVSCIGFKTDTIQINADRSTNLKIKLTVDTKLLNDVLVKSGKRNYRNRNNPSVGLIEKVIENKGNNKLEALDYYENEKYEKILFALSDIKPEFKQRKSFSKFQFVFENTDTSMLKGKEVLPIYLKENISEYYFKKSTKSEKEIIKANKMVSFDGYLNDRGVAEYLKYMYQDINIYSNNITFLTNQFLSPIASSAPVFYRYYIVDTTMVSGDKCVKMFFSPRNKTDLLFQGYLYIMLDSSYAVRQIDMSVNKDINLNWVKDVNISQKFEKTPNKGWLLTSDDINIDFGLTQSGMGVFGRRTVSYKNYAFDPTEIEKVLKEQETVVPDSIYKLNNDYWEIHRHQQLSKSEKGTYSVIDSVQKVPSFKRAMDVASLLLFGYKDFGYYEIGPVNTFYSYNPIEGARLRLGGRSTQKFSKKLNLETYIAYGFKDEKYKYYLGTTWSLTPNTIYEFPVKYLKVSYQDETKIPGQDLQFVQEDNILLSIKRGVNDKLFYNKTFKIEHLNEFANHFSYTVGYQFAKERPGGNLFFNYSNYQLHENDKQSIDISELYLNMRFAPHEQFYQGKLYRTPILNRYPVFELQFFVGSKLLKNDYNYQRLHLIINKRFYPTILGYTDVVWEAGKIFGRVPYPLLSIHRANQTYSYQILSYNMMNFLEFVSDQYTSLNIDHCFNGFFFNKIPIIKKLKLRELISCKILYGSVSKKNNPDYNNDLFKYPVEADGTPITYTLEHKPYIEASVGVGNVFKLFRVDVVKRLTYLDHPEVSEWGIRARFKFDF
jgi:hypothetical protein